MAGTHALLSPSSAERWTECPASVAACKDLPNPPSEASALGTAKHKISEWCLQEGRTADCCVGQEVEADGLKFRIDDEFADHCNMYVSVVRGLPGARTLEQKVDTSRVLGVAGQSGTLDCSVESVETGTLYIVDAKFGFQPVKAKGNKQLLIYAAAKLDEVDPDALLYSKVVLMICQPKQSDKPDVHTYPRDVVDAELAEIRLKAQQAYILAHAAPADVEGAKTPTDTACRWCPVRENCTARDRRVMDSFPLTVAGANPVNLRPQQLAEYLERVDEIELWCRDVRAEALKRALAGEKIPGWFVGKGRKGNRRFPNEELARMGLQEILGENGVWTEPKLVAPAEAERRAKAAKKMAEFKEFAAWAIDQPDGAPSLMRDGETGEPYTVGPEFGLEPPR